MVLSSGLLLSENSSSSAPQGVWGHHHPQFTSHGCTSGLELRTGITQDGDSGMLMSVLMGFPPDTSEEGPALSNRKVNEHSQ